MTINKDIIIPLFVSFFVSLILCPIVIPLLSRLKVGQTERVEGVQSHLKKAGTPTMGGLVILAGIVIASLFYVRKDPEIIPVLLLILGFGILGFIDDFLKVVLRRSDGLLSWQKMIGQFIVTTIFIVYIWVADRSCLDMLIPFSNGYVITGDAWHGAFKYFAAVLAYIAIIGTVNGVNFTDGLDGLASSVTIMVAIFFTIVSVVFGGNIEPLTAAVAGALAGFLIFNIYPAKVFMGDTGSLALGGFVAGSAYLMKMPIFILIIGLVYLVEVLSVILQVAYFRRTGGKRLFKMTPIHHHFELCGWSEPRIVTVFTVVTAILCIIGLAGCV